MCADFLEACINGIDLQSPTNNYRIYTNSNSVADVTEIENVWFNGVRVRDQMQESKKEAQEKGFKALCIYWYADSFVKWAQDQGDTVIRTRHINNPVMSLISEMNETDPLSTSNVKYISFLQNRILHDNKLTTNIRNVPYVDQNDYLTPITDKLQSLVPDFNTELHNKNLNWYLDINLQGIKDLDRINSILTKSVSSSYEKKEGMKLKGFKMKLHNNKLDLTSGWNMISDDDEGVGVEMEILEESEDSVTVKILKIDKQDNDVREYKKRPPGMYG
tara:strand:+ start:87 stop:911 length:825 start_codon:yes stop_codon:yes gene_type:complete